jgi:hypothetical protein
VIIAEVWNSNRERCGGRFNLYFFWVYPLVLPLALTWDFLNWLERALTPKAKRS